MYSKLCFVIEVQKNSEKKIKYLIISMFQVYDKKLLNSQKNIITGQIIY